MNGFERPPLRVNRNFFYESENIFKLLEIILTPNDTERFTQKSEYIATYFYAYHNSMSKLHRLVKHREYGLNNHKLQKVDVQNAVQLYLVAALRVICTMTFWLTPFFALGICCAIFNAQCFPNDVVLRCTYTMHSVTQLFSVVCVNAFFLVTTTALVLCNLFGVVDSYYKFNFPVVERRVYLLTVIMYIVSLIMVIAAISQSRFVSAWVFPLIFTALTTVTYVYDLIRKYDGSP